jgi:glutaredoxin
MELSVIVFTMKGCPFCKDFKDMLSEAEIDFIERDIDEHKDEYDLFSEINKNDMIPALLIIESDDQEHKAYQYVPERDYNELTEALAIVRNHLSIL